MEKDVTNLELHELRVLLDAKQVSAVELVKLFLEKIQTQDKELNCFLTVPEEQAISQAEVADKYIASPGENPFLCGIPYAAKDLFCTAGVRTTASSKILDNYIPPYNATVIAKINEQMGVLLGKTNLDQFTHGSSTETSGYGPTKNPWDKTRIPGGSSGGSSAAVAAGLAPRALGTETGGSIRQPSALCGVSGWKPTYGRVSRYGVIAMGSSLAVTVPPFSVSLDPLAAKSSLLDRFYVAHNQLPRLPALKLQISNQYDPALLPCPRESLALAAPSP
jgi:aspartyl-tRNA(Asn)/glutamyl-tRNA(Gln) amidotransferase subunit A